MLATIMSLAAEGGEEAVETVNPVLPTMPELIYGTVFFIALWVLMRYVLLPPVRGVMRQRDEQRLADEEGTERAKVEAEKVRRDYDATLAEARAQASVTVDEARARGEARRAELTAAAEADAAEIRRAALAELDAERAEALSGARPQVAELAGTAASKVLGRTVDPAVAQRIAETYLAPSEN
ncbi:MAG: F0F1 ATP synthase subunit B [Microthrixaceae bacterium]